MPQFSAASEPREILVETPQYKVFQCVAMIFEFLSSSDAWAILLALSGIPLPEAPPGHICNLLPSNPVWDLNLEYSC